MAIAVPIGFVAGRATGQIRPDEPTRDAAVAQGANTGYRLVAADGGVFGFGAPFRGSASGLSGSPIVGMAADPATGGYWLVAADGGVFGFGAPSFGSTGGKPLDRPVVGMAAAPGGDGYWLVASDGGVFGFGPGAVFHGSTGGVRLDQPIVGMAADPATGGYWLVAADGGVFGFDAPFSGSTGGVRLDRPVVGMAAAPGGDGYWLVASDGGVFGFGPGAVFHGSTGSLALRSPVVAISVSGPSSSAPPSRTPPTTLGPTPTTAPTTVVPGTYWVYHDSTFSWPGDYSYSAAINYKDTTGNAPGGYDDIEVSLTGDYGAWQPYSFGYSFDSTPYKYLTFELKPTVAGQTWSCQFIKVGDIPVGISLDVSDYGPAPSPGQWNTYTIPLSALGVADTSIYKFAIQDQTGLTSNHWYIDNVGFVP